MGSALHDSMQMGKLLLITRLREFCGLYVASGTIGLDKIERDNRGTSHFSIKSHDCSVFVVNPGCPDHFLHRVWHELSVTDRRYSISLRSMIPKSNQKEGAVNEQSSTVAAATYGQQSQPPPNHADPFNETQPQLKPKRRKQLFSSAHQWHSD